MATTVRSIETAPSRRGGRSVRYLIAGPTRVKACTDVLTISGHASRMRRIADELYACADEIDQSRSIVSRILGSLPQHDTLNGRRAA